MTLPKASYEFYRTQLARQGFTILLNGARPEFVADALQTTSNTCWEKLTLGDTSTHSWREIALMEPIPNEYLLREVDIAKIIGAKPANLSQWINIYGPGEYIAGHRDAGGDIQLVIPLELPPPDGGGELWIGGEDRRLPIGVGDVLVFAASKLLHGTNPIREGRRISFNSRMWLL